MHASKQLRVSATVASNVCMCTMYSSGYSPFSFSYVRTYFSDFDSYQAMYKSKLSVIICSITCTQSNFYYFLCNS